MLIMHYQAFSYTNLTFYSIDNNFEGAILIANWLEFHFKWTSINNE